MINLLMLLAQTSQPAQPAPSGMESLFRGPLVPLLLVIVVFFWWTSRSRNKERRKFEDMLNSLKRNDRVQTIGGVLGTVVETRGSEVILKVDETNNVKMRFNRSAIKEMIVDAPESE